MLPEDKAQFILEHLRGDGSKGTLVAFPWEGLHETIRELLQRIEDLEDEIWHMS